VLVFNREQPGESRLPTDAYNFGNLFSVATVTGLELIVDELGYTPSDCLKITISTGYFVSDLSLVCEWDLQSYLEEKKEILPKSNLVLTFPAVNCKVLSLTFRFSINLNEGMNRFLHLGKLKINYSYNLLTVPQQMQSPQFSGTSPHPILSVLPFSDSKLYESLLLSSSKTQLQAVRPLWSQWRNNYKLLDLSFDGTAAQPSGFSLVIHHGEEGHCSQIKAIRVIGITTNNQGQVSSMKQILQVLVPLSKAGTALFYPLVDAQKMQVNMLTFEFRSNYGGKETSPPSLTIWARSETK
jgi:hypothetical protein